MKLRVSQCFTPLPVQLERRPWSMPVGGAWDPPLRPQQSLQGPIGAGCRKSHHMAWPLFKMEPIANATFSNSQRVSLACRNQKCTSQVTHPPPQKWASASWIVCTTGKLTSAGSGLLPGRSASTTRQPAAAAACASRTLSVANSTSAALSTPNDSAMLL